MIKYRIEWEYFNSKPNNKYRSTVQEFNDERHFENFLNYCNKNQDYRKIIGHERHYEESKDYSANDLKAAFDFAKKGQGTFQDFLKIYLKREL